MKLLKLLKDGGAESRVWAYFLVEIKGLFSVALLRFEDGSREAYHSHAFNAVSWVLRGTLEERLWRHWPKSWGCAERFWYRPSWRPIVTRRQTCHKVVSHGRTWVLTFRGPWADRWHEHVPGRGRVELTHGRKEVLA